MSAFVYAVVLRYAVLNGHQFFSFKLCLFFFLAKVNYDIMVLVKNKLLAFAILEKKECGFLEVPLATLFLALGPPTLIF